MTRAAPEVAHATRRGLHVVAERVLAAARWTWTGRIGLDVDERGLVVPGLDVPDPAPGGPEGPDGITGLRTDGAELVVVRHGREERTPLRTLGVLLEAVGRPLREPGSYVPSSDGDLDAPLGIDGSAALDLVGWLDRGRRALEAFAVEIAADEPTAPTLWPEHFDLAISAAGVNYGVSPGDAAGDGGDPDPYAYVGPHRPPPTGSGDGFWNRPYGRWVDAGSIDGTDGPNGIDGIAACFRSGRARFRDGSTDA